MEGGSEPHEREAQRSPPPQRGTAEAPAVQAPQRPQQIAPRVMLTHEQTVTYKARSITCIQIRSHNIIHIDVAGHLHSTRQSHDAKLISSAFLSASASTFNSL